MTTEALITPGVLSHWRSTLEINQHDMAALLGVPLPTYIKWEQGTRKPNTIANQTIVLMHWLEQHHPNVFEQVRGARMRQAEAKKGDN